MQQIKMIIIPGVQLSLNLAWATGRHLSMERSSSTQLSNTSHLCSNNPNSSPLQAEILQASQYIQISPSYNSNKTDLHPMWTDLLQIYTPSNKINNFILSNTNNNRKGTQ